MLDSRKREIRIKADDFRERCKVSRYGIIDLFKECDRLGYKLIRYPLGESADLGFTVRRDKDIIIFTNSCSRLSREIFTLAHEIGHIILHIERENSFVDDKITITGKSTNENEQEANYFAACLLMPAEEVHRFVDLELQESGKCELTAMDIARMMSEFNVSFDMALNRLEALGLIDASQRLCLDSEKVQRRVGNLLQCVGGNAKLNISSKEIRLPYEYIDYVIYNYNHNVIPKETLEKALACYQLSIEDVRDQLIAHSETDDDLDDLIGGLDD